MSYKKAQVWIETVIYTLIGLTVIAIVLTSALPQIEKAKDKQVITQTVESLAMLDSKISETRDGPNNVRKFQLKISKGRIEIDPVNDLIIYKMENTKLKFSEPGEIVRENDLITAETQKSGGKFNVILVANYSKEIDITYNGEEEVGIIQPGTSIYQITMTNRGYTAGTNMYNVDFTLS